MKLRKWVQHISEKGEKWELSGCPYNDQGNDDWQVIPKTLRDNFGFHYLPKSEYIPCDPPEVWRDVTAECVVDSSGTITHNGLYTTSDCHYRRRKLSAEELHGHQHSKMPYPWAIIIEQKVPQL